MTKRFTDCLTERGRENLVKVYAILNDGKMADMTPPWLEGWETDELLQFEPKIEDTEEIAKIMTRIPKGKHES